MLVLSRKIGQTIVIGDGIEITVVDLRGDQVRLGIHAPREIPVNRKEILERICAHRQSASAPAVPVEAISPLSTPDGVLSPVSDRIAEALVAGDPRAARV